MCPESQAPEIAATILCPMGNKYYAHFIAEPPDVAAHAEWTGVVELTRPLRSQAEERELSLVLACSMDVELEEIRIIDWSPLH